MVNEPEEQEFLLKKSKFLDTCMEFSIVSRFFWLANIKLTEKHKNSALDMFLVVNDPEEQEFSLKKSKFQQILENMF
jgi:hypothetical protein